MQVPQRLQSCRPLKVGMGGTRTRLRGIYCVGYASKKSTWDLMPTISLPLSRWPHTDAVDGQQATAAPYLPGSPRRIGLFFVRLLRIWTVLRISSSRPMTGSSFPSRAACVKSRLYFSSAYSRRETMQQISSIFRHRNCETVMISQVQHQL